jgi:hypothetical protein
MKAAMRNCTRPFVGVPSRIALAATLVFALQQQAQAAEGGVGFYLLGSRGPRAGVVPPPGFYVQNDFYVYSGSAGADRDLPIGG